MCFSETEIDIILLILFYNLLRFDMFYCIVWMSQHRREKKLNPTKVGNIYLTCTLPSSNVTIPWEQQSWVLSQSGLRNNKQSSLSWVPEPVTVKARQKSHVEILIWPFSTKCWHLTALCFQGLTPSYYQSIRGLLSYKQGLKFFEDNWALGSRNVYCA